MRLGGGDGSLEMAHVACYACELQGWDGIRSIEVLGLYSASARPYPVCLAVAG